MRQWFDKRWLYGLIAIGVCVLAYFGTPGQSKWLPSCLFNTWTGLYCPGCGNTRALHAFVHGDILNCISNNLLLIPACILLVVLCLYPKLSCNKYLCWSITVVVIVFFILRNLPWYPFTLLAPNGFS